MAVLSINSGIFGRPGLVAVPVPVDIGSLRCTRVNLFHVPALLDHKACRRLPSVCRRKPYYPCTTRNNNRKFCVKSNLNEYDTHPPLDKHNNSIQWQNVFLPFLFPALGGLLFGYDIGGTSGALLSLKDAGLSGTGWYDLSATATGLVVSGSLTGALLGSATAFVIADPLGRRRELLLSAALFFAGSLLMASASSVASLVAGKVVYGLGIGLAMHAAPMYIAETSPAAVRGTLVSLKECFIVAGILLGYVSGASFVPDVGGWREIFVASAPVAVAMAAGMLWLPPSPRWLLLQAAAAQSKSFGWVESPGESSPLLSSGEFMADKVQRLKREAVVALRRLRGGGWESAEGEQRGNEEEQEVESMFADMVEANEKGRSDGEGGGALGGLGELVRGASARALIVGVGLVLFQQISGQPSVLYYAAQILQDAGFSAAADATKVAVGLGAFKLAMTGFAVVYVDSLGRRPLLLAGISGLVLSLLLLASSYQLPPGSMAPAFSVAALLLYVGSYQLSFGPISWLMVSEIFPSRVRGRAQSVATLVNFGANALVTFSFAPIQEALGQSGTFYMFAGIGLIALGFVYTIVPETKGLTLEEIEAKLSTPN